MSATDDPVPIGDLVNRRREQLQARIAEIAEKSKLHRATQEALEVEDESEPRELDYPQRRRATWRRVIPERFQYAALADMADQDPAALADLVEWAARHDGRNLVLLGPVGTGKTHAAVAAVRPAFFDRGADVRFLPVVELLDLLRPGGPERALYDLADVEVLVIDDLGTERPTDWTSERLYAVINRRWLEGRPTVATSNLSADQLAAALGPASYSRLVGSGAIALALTGPDRRRTRP